MAGEFELIDGRLIIRFTYEADRTVVENIINDAAENLYNRTYQQYDANGVVIPFDTLTNKQRLNIVDDHVKAVIIALANTWKSEEAQRLARQQEEENEYEL